MRLRLYVVSFSLIWLYELLMSVVCIGRERYAVADHSGTSRRVILGVSFTYSTVPEPSAGGRAHRLPARY